MDLLWELYPCGYEGLFTVSDLLWELYPCHLFTVLDLLWELYPCHYIGVVDLLWELYPTVTKVLFLITHTVEFPMGVKPLSLEGFICNLQCDVQPLYSLVGRVSQLYKHPKVSSNFLLTGVNPTR